MAAAVNVLKLVSVEGTHYVVDALMHLGEYFLVVKHKTRLQCYIVSCL